MATAKHIPVLVCLLGFWPAPVLANYTGIAWKGDAAILGESLEVVLLDDGAPPPFPISSVQWYWQLRGGGESTPFNPTPGETSTTVDLDRPGTWIFIVDITYMGMPAFGPGPQLTPPPKSQTFSTLANVGPITDIANPQGFGAAQALTVAQPIVWTMTTAAGDAGPMINAGVQWSSPARWDILRGWLPATDWTGTAEVTIPQGELTDRWDYSADWVWWASLDPGEPVFTALMTYRLPYQVVSNVQYMFVQTAPTYEVVKSDNFTFYVSGP
jgi:hypothetical protein